MFKGSVATRWFLMSAVLVSLPWSATVVLAQTTPEQCELDSLVLLSPEENGVNVRLSEPGERFGNYIHWEPPAPEVATCATIRDQDLLPLPVELTGTYLDQVDREISFFADQGGAVGSPTLNRLIVSWSNKHVSRSGSVEGQINLSNNGGILRFRTNSNTWQQINAGLPRFLPSTDILAIAQSSQSPDHLLLHLGSQGVANPAGSTLGLWERQDGSAWSRVAEDQFPDGVVISKVVFSPDSDQEYAVGTRRNGLYVTRDGGTTFEQWARNLDPTIPDPPLNYEVTSVTWEAGGTLYVSIRNFGLFVSRDNGVSFENLPNLLVRQDLQNPVSPLVFPIVNQIRVDPSDADHILVAINNHALYHSTDAGDSWSAMTGDWILPTDDSWRHSGVAVDLDPQDGQTILVGTSQKGIWRTSDGGDTWLRVAEDIYPQEESLIKPVRSLFFDPSRSGEALVFIDKIGILVTGNSGVSWAAHAQQPNNVSGTEMHLQSTGTGDLLLASYAGGIYTAGTAIPLSETITNSNIGELDLGLFLTFGEGTVPAGLSFEIVCQDFQGYAIWRSDGTDPFNLQLIGLYDKTNPETCIEGFCGDQNYNITPNCFNEKRAACFDFDPPDGGVEFFDDTIYNGFTYFYAVSTFDYLNTAGVEPTAIDQDLLFSPRFPSQYTDEETGVPPGEEPLEPKDPGSPFWGRGNLVAYQVNLAALPAEDGPEIYVFPNPLRSQVGFPGKEGNEVVFTNLPPESRVQVFTSDGDIVADLGPDLQAGANIYWTTVNESQELLASGIYLWKVSMQSRGEFWGKLVIIR